MPNEESLLPHDVYHLAVPAEAAGQRADVFLANANFKNDRVLYNSTPSLTRAAAQRLLDAGEVTRVETILQDDNGMVEDAVYNIANGITNGSTVNYIVVGKNNRVAAGDILHVRIPAPAPADILPEPIALDIVYEDSDIIVINKPRGLVVHPAAGHYNGTLVNALLYHCRGELSGIGGVERPGIVHRLDKDTSGLLVVAKNDAAHNSLSTQLAARTIKRIYNALCLGYTKNDTFTIDAPIGRHPKDRQKMAVWERTGRTTSNRTVKNKNGRTASTPLPPGYREAVTHFTVLERLNTNPSPASNQKPRLTLVEARLETGRTHQIRVHLAHVGHPVWGDTVYGPEKQPKINGYKPEGQMLHARNLLFIHPTTGKEMMFESEPPWWKDGCFYLYKPG